MAEINGQALPFGISQMAQNVNNAVNGIEQQMIEACTVDLKNALDKYGCALVYEEVKHNGIPVAGRFVVAKRKEE